MRQLRALLCLCKIDTCRLFEHSFILSLALIYIPYVHTQILYECNFDISTENCFTPEISVTSNVGNPSSLIPNGPLSDVTSSCKKNINILLFLM